MCDRNGTRSITKSFQYMLLRGLIGGNYIPAMSRTMMTAVEWVCTPASLTFLVVGDICVLFLSLGLSCEIICYSKEAFQHILSIVLPFKIKRKAHSCNVSMASF